MNSVTAGTFSNRQTIRFLNGMHLASAEMVLKIHLDTLLKLDQLLYITMFFGLFTYEYIMSSPLGDFGLQVYNANSSLGP